MPPNEINHLQGVWDYGSDIADLLQTRLRKRYRRLSLLMAAYPCIDID